ncbi:MAG: hypothetical protein WAQ32_00530 [Dethiobacteria bacterium]|nr:hypothetical protein [Bacillota bacterium]HQD52181.1 hypothetical protein [Bacillota bacterium]
MTPAHSSLREVSSGSPDETIGEMTAALFHLFIDLDPLLLGYEK